MVSFFFLTELPEKYGLFTIAPIAGALSNKTLDFFIQIVTNHFEVLKTRTHMTAYVSAVTLCAFSYFCLWLTGHLTADSKASPLAIIPITGGLTIKIIEPALKKFSRLPYTLDKIRSTWKDHLSNPEKIQGLSTLLAYIFENKRITSRSIKEQTIKSLLNKGTNFESLQRIFQLQEL